jgi:putative nucleotidyltransferase with HDIG domain
VGPKLTIALVPSSLLRTRRVSWPGVETRTRIYLAALALLALGVAGLLVSRHTALEDEWSVMGLAVAACIAERGRVRLTDRHEESISLLPTLFAAVLAGPLAGFVVGAASFALDCRPPFARWGVYTSTRAVSGAGAGFAAHWLTASRSSSFQTVLLETLVAAVTIEALDGAFLILTGAVRSAYTHLWDVARARLPLMLSSLPLAVPVVAMLVVAQRSVSPWTLPLFFAPALTAHRLFVMYQSKSILASSLSDANRKLEEASLALAASLVAALDARDRYTAGHSAAVAVHARAIAEELGFSPSEAELVHRSGLVHDIGKIGLPEWLLEKSGPLTPSERSLIERHPVTGAEILEKGGAQEDLIEAIRHHHERFDGAGYPCGLRGAEIPLIARVLAVADSYDAMVSDRPYRQALSPEEALRRLLKGRGSQFDPHVVDAFKRYLGVPLGSPDVIPSESVAELTFSVVSSESVAFA